MCSIAFYVGIVDIFYPLQMNILTAKFSLETEDWLVQ